MASRFWVGGTGTWDAADTTHWSASSGGAGGASVPAAADDVFFDGSSGVGTATVAINPTIQSLTCTGYTGTLSITGTMTVGSATSGSFTLSAGMTLTGALTLSVTTVGATVGTITTAGKTLAALNINGNGTWRLLDATTVTGQVALGSGTFDTNGKTCNWGTFASTAANVRVLTLGASAITVTAAGVSSWNVTTFTNLTVTANTATVTLSGASAGLTTGNGNWNGTSFVMTGGGTMGVTSGTVANLTVIGTASKTGILEFQSANPFVATDTLTITGNSLTNRLLVQSSTFGTARSISAAFVSLTNADFSDVTGLGTAVWNAPTNLCTNGGFETNLTGWSTAGVATFTRDNGQAKFGSWSLKGVAASSTDTHEDIAITGLAASTTYAISAWVNCTAFTAGAFNNRALAAFDAADVATFQTTVLTAATTGWVRHTIVVTTTAAAGAHTINLRLYCPNGTIYWDGVQVETGATATNTVNTGGAALAASLGDALGNSGITFTAPAAQAWVGTSGGNWSDVTKWTSRVPLPQDDVTISAAFIPAQTVVADMPRLGRGVSFVGVSGSPVFDHSSITVAIYGSLTFAAGLGSHTSGQHFRLQGRSAQTLTNAGKSWGFNLDVIAPGGTYTLQDDLPGNSQLVLVAGTLDANGKNLNLGSFVAAASAACTLKMGSGTWTLTSTGTVWNVSPTNLTVTPGTATIDVTDATAAAKTFIGGGVTYPTLRHRSAGSGGLTITGENAFANLDLECSTARTVTLTSGTSQVVLGTLTLQGAVGQLLALAASSAGQQAGLWVLPGGTLTQTLTSVSADVVITSGQNVHSLNVITDASRAAALLWGTGQQGGMTDGAAAGSGYGVRRAATNLFRRGQCDAVTDWNTLLAGSSVALDATTPPPFSTQSIKVTTNGGTANQGVEPSSAAGQAAAAATVGVGSTYFKGVAGQSYIIRAYWLNGDASFTVGTDTTFTATGAWQLITPTSIAVAVGKTGDTLRMQIIINGTRAESFWVAHAMLEKGQSVVAPYVATSGGATATRGAARVRVSTALSATKGSVELRVRMSVGSAALSATLPNSSNQLVFFVLADDANNFLFVRLVQSTGSFDVRRRAGGVGNTASITGKTWNAGDTITLIVTWDTTTVALSYNGGAFVSAANATVPALATTLADIGTGGTVFGLGEEIEGDVVWQAETANKLVDADAARIAAFPSSDPDFSGEPAVINVWNALTASYEVPPVDLVAPVAA